MLEHTKRVTFELSNCCDLAHAHARCPAHLAARLPITLPAEIVDRELGWLGDCGYAGELAFHNYSEPLIDPRLFEFLNTAALLVRKASVYILTNGLILTQVLLDELVLHGVKRLYVSAYTDDEFARLKGFKRHGIDYMVKRFAKLDDRLTIYDRQPKTSPGPCAEPLYNLLVRATGDVCLCCNDWRATRTYGNLDKMTLAEVLETGRMQADYARLSIGDRFLPICRRCGVARGMPA